MSRINFKNTLGKEWNERDKKRKERLKEIKQRTRLLIELIQSDLSNPEKCFVARAIAEAEKIHSLLQTCKKKDKLTSDGYFVKVEESKENGV